VPPCGSPGSPGPKGMSQKKAGISGPGVGFISGGAQILSPVREVGPTGRESLFPRFGAQIFPGQCVGARNTGVSHGGNGGEKVPLSLRGGGLHPLGRIKGSTTGRRTPVFLEKPPSGEWSFSLLGGAQ